MSVTLSTARHMLSRTAKKFALKDLVKAKDLKHHNLFEMVSVYPTRGLGFRVRKVDWPAGKYYVISEVQLKTNRTGTMYGVLYENNHREDTLPVEITNATSRGMWTYEIGDSNCVLDNGIRYNAAVMLDFWKDEVKKYNSLVVDLAKDTEDYWNDIEKKRLQVMK